jgi:hypothetical protein
VDFTIGDSIDDLFGDLFEESGRSAWPSSL